MYRRLWAALPQKPPLGLGGRGDGQGGGGPVRSLLQYDGAAVGPRGGVDSAAIAADTDVCAARVVGSARLDAVGQRAHRLKGR